MKIVHLAVYRDMNVSAYFLQQNLKDHHKSAENNDKQEEMKESKAVYVTKHKIRDDQKIVYHLYRSECGESGRIQERINFGSQFDSRRDNSICTCKNTRRFQEFKYFSGLPKQVYACHGPRGFVDIGVGSVKTIQRRRVKRIYLPETDETGVGSTDLSSFIWSKRYPKVVSVSSYYDHKKTSSKCIGGILEYNTGCVIHQKLSPIIHTKSGTTSPKRSSILLKDTEIGSNIIEARTESIGTQFEVIESEHREITLPKFKSSLALNQEPPKITINQTSELKLDLKMSDHTEKSKCNQSPEDKITKLQPEKKEKDVILTYSSDSLVQHVHNLENPCDDKHSKTSLQDPMENKLEREYRKMFATTKSKDSKLSCDKPVPEFKSASVLKRRFEALKRGMVKKEESNSKKKDSVSMKSSNGDIPMRKDASVTSDPPSLISRSFSDTAKYKAAIEEESKREKIKNTSPKKEKRSSEWPPHNSVEGDGQGVKGMFKLWGKKFNFEEEASGKRQATPMPSYEKSKKAEKEEPLKSGVKENRKENKKFFFFKKKSKEKTKNSCLPKKNVTAGRCEIKDGIVLKFGDAKTARVKSETSEEAGEIIHRSWMRRFMTESMESARSVNVRWNNSLYTTSSSTVFELLDSVYKNNNVDLSQSDETSPVSSYFKSFTKQVNFVQDIEAWMIPRTITDKPVPKQIPIKQLPLRQIPLHINSERGMNEKNIEFTTSDQKWYIEKSEAFSHKIEVVLHSNNTTDISNKKPSSSEYLKIDIPGDFFDTSSDESKQNQSSDEEVYKIVEYETESDIVRAKKVIKELNKGDHVPTDIKLIVSVKDSKNRESKILETVIKRPPSHKDAIIQGNDEDDSQMCDVIGVGIITQKDLKEIRKPILKIRDDTTDEESVPLLQMKQKKSDFTESYLHEYYSHWTPFGDDIYPWCVSGSQYRSSSIQSFSSIQHLGDGSKSCPNIYEDLEATIATTCEASNVPCKNYTYEELIKEKLYNKMIQKFKKPVKAKTDSELNKTYRVQPKDSLEVFKRRKIINETTARSEWAKYCCNVKDVTCAVPSVHSEKGCANEKNSHKNEKSDNPNLKAKIRNKRVSLLDCDAVDVNKRTAGKPIEGILNFKKPISDISKPKYENIKHTVVKSNSSCGNQQLPYNETNGVMIKSHYNKSNTLLCNTATSYKSISPYGTPFCSKPGVPSELIISVSSYKISQHAININNQPVETLPSNKQTQPEKTTPSYSFVICENCPRSKSHALETPTSKNQCRCCKIPPTKTKSDTSLTCKKSATEEKSSNSKPCVCSTSPPSESSPSTPPQTKNHLSSQNPISCPCKNTSLTSESPSQSSISPSTEKPLCKLPCKDFMQCNKHNPPPCKISPILPEKKSNGPCCKKSLPESSKFPSCTKCTPISALSPKPKGPPCKSPLCNLPSCSTCKKSSPKESPEKNISPCSGDCKNCCKSSSAISSSQSKESPCSSPKETPCQSEEEEEPKETPTSCPIESSSGASIKSPCGSCTKSPEGSPKQSRVSLANQSPKCSQKESSENSLKASSKCLAECSIKNSPNSSQKSSPKCSGECLIQESPKSSPQESPKCSPKESPKSSLKASSKCSPECSIKESPKCCSKESLKSALKTSSKCSINELTKTLPKASSKCSPECSMKESPKCCSKESLKSALKTSSKCSAECSINESTKNLPKESSKCPGKCSINESPNSSPKKSSKCSAECSINEPPKSSPTESSKCSAECSIKESPKYSPEESQKSPIKALSKCSPECSINESSKSLPIKSSKCLAECSKKETPKCSPEEAPKTSIKTLSKCSPQCAINESPKSSIKQPSKCSAECSIKALPKSSPKQPSKCSPECSAKESPKNSPKESSKCSEECSIKELPKSSPKQPSKCSPECLAKESPKNSPKESSKCSEECSIKESPKCPSKESPKTSLKASSKCSPECSINESPKNSPKKSSKCSAECSPKETPKSSLKASSKCSSECSTKETPKSSLKETLKCSPECSIKDSSKGSTTQSQKCSPPQSLKYSPPQSPKGTPPQTQKCSPPQSQKSSPSQSQKSSPTQSQKISPPQSQKSSPPQSQKNSSPQSKKSSPTQSPKSEPENMPCDLPSSSPESSGQNSSQQSTQSSEPSSCDMPDCTTNKLLSPPALKGGISLKQGRAPPPPPPAAVPSPPPPPPPPPPKTPKRKTCGLPPCNQLKPLPKPEKPKKIKKPKKKEKSCGDNMPVCPPSPPYVPPPPKPPKCNKYCTLKPDSEPESVCEPPQPPPPKSSRPFTHPCCQKSGISGLLLKLMPAKKKTCASDCSAWNEVKENNDDACDDLTENVKETTACTEDFREPINIKVQDEDGATLYERKDYTCSNQHEAVLEDLYKESKMKRLKPMTVTNMIEDDNKKELTSYVSDKSLLNSVEINFKLRITQGDKTTEIDIENDNDEKRKDGARLNQSHPEVYMVNNEKPETTDENPRNDINIKITLRNFKSKQKRNISKDIKRTEEFSQKISDKFHTVSTGYSDIEDENVFSIHRATINLASSADTSHICSEVPTDNKDNEPNCATSFHSTDGITDMTEDNDEIITKDEQNTIVDDTCTNEPLVPNINGTDTEEDATLMTLNKGDFNDNSSIVMSKRTSKEQKKSLLKKVFQKAGKRSKNKENVRELRDMLKIILTDSSDNEETNVGSNELAKDVTYTSLKPNYFRDTDSMNNYYQIDSNLSSMRDDSNIDTIYATEDNNSKTSNSEENNDTDKGCLCSKVAARLNKVKDNKPGCCCRRFCRKDEETNCDIRNATDYFLLNYKTAEYADVETQNSRRLSSNINSYNISIRSSSKRESFTEETEETNLIIDEIQSITTPSQNKSSAVIRKDSLVKESRTNAEESEILKMLKISNSKRVSRNVSHRKSITVDSEMKHLYQNIELDEDELSRKLTELSLDKSKRSSKKCKRSEICGNNPDILQSYAAKKAVLEIYAEKAENGDNFVAKLPKFVIGRESEITNNFEQIASNYKSSVYEENVFIMSVKK